MKPSRNVYDKYNRSMKPHFTAPGAAKKFLGDIGLSMSKPIPDNYGDNKDRMTYSEEKQHFAALHFVKFWINHAHSKDRLCHLKKLYDAIRNRIICANVGLIYRCIQLTSINIDYDTLLGSGHLALLEATERFDPYRGVRFSTYASVSILRRFSREIKHKRLPVQEDYDLFEVSDTDNEPDSDTQIYLERLEIFLKEATKKPSSDDLSLSDLDILIKRFNLGEKNKKHMTLAEVAAGKNVCKERIRQLQKSAMTKLRRKFEECPILQ